MAPATMPLRTPDGRYIVVRGRLWRASDPGLDEALRERLVDQLMNARRAVGIGGRKNDAAAVRHARDQVNEAKHALGERGPVWWTDSAPDFNRHMARTTPYAQWYESVGMETGTPGPVDPAGRVEAGRR